MGCYSVISGVLGIPAKAYALFMSEGLHRKLPAADTTRGYMFGSFALKI